MINDKNKNKNKKNGGEDEEINTYHIKLTWKQTLTNKIKANAFKILYFITYVALVICWIKNVISFRSIKDYNLLVKTFAADFDIFKFTQIPVK